MEQLRIETFAYPNAKYVLVTVEHFDLDWVGEQEYSVYELLNGNIEIIVPDMRPEVGLYQAEATLEMVLGVIEADYRAWLRNYDPTPA